MKVRGMAIDQGVREAKGYHIAWGTLLDENLQRVVEVTYFLKDGAASPFAGQTKGATVEYAVRSVDIRRGVISCGLKSAA